MPIWSRARGADGAHRDRHRRIRATRSSTLKPDWIAGVGGLASRHDAMTAAEHGADYVMFGEPDAAGVRPSFAAIEERVAWWAELFETPCVGYAGVARRSRAAGDGRRRFCRARRLALARSQRRRASPKRRVHLRLPEPAA